MSDEKITRIGEELFHEVDRLCPVEASILGIYDYADEMDSFSASDRAKMDAINKEFRSRLEAVPDNELSRTGLTEKRLLQSYLYGSDRYLHRSREWQRDPSVYLDLAVFAPYILLIREYAPLEERVGSIIKRLEKIPDVLAQGKQNLENPPEIYTRIGEETAEGAIASLGTLFERVAEEVPSRKEEILSASKKAIDAIADFKKYLHEYLLPISKGNYAAGEELFNDILKNENYLQYDADLLWKIGHMLFEETEKELNEVGEKLYPGHTWPEVLEILREHHPPADELVKEYAQSTEKVREFVVKNDLVEIPPGESLDVIPTPEFMRCTIPYAAYMPPGYYDKKQHAHFWVTPIDSKLPAEEQEKCLREHAYSKIHYVVLHESYPGHHLQLTTVSTLKSDILKRVHTNLFIEGWAFYCEQMMMEQGYLDEEGHFAQLKDQLWRAARVILDVGLHTGRISYDEAVKFLEEKVATSSTAAMAEVKRYTRTPTQPLSYFIGKLEILKIRDMFTDNFPEMTLKQFHQKLLTCGSMPPALIPGFLGIKETAVK
ncbi:MAG: DUF885 domain-containing protein [Candidatus Eremiobacteraeota bacterium]|nr:DUF885 domain-containing protein [Candidatus Eremiobacteraeota bacterium]